MSSVMEALLAQSQIQSLKEGSIVKGRITEIRQTNADSTMPGVTSTIGHSSQSKQRKPLFRDASCNKPTSANDNPHSYTTENKV